MKILAVMLKDLRLVLRELRGRLVELRGRVLLPAVHEPIAPILGDPAHGRELGLKA